MILRLLSIILLSFLCSSVFSQKKFTAGKDLRSEWLSYDDGVYEHVGEMPFIGLNTIYFQLNPQAHRGEYLSIRSNKPYFLFVNGQILGEFRNLSRFRIDSLLGSENRLSRIAIHQKRINERDLVTEITGRNRPVAADESLIARRPYDPFRDFVVIAGLLIIFLFLVAFRINPKLGSDYFAVARMFTSREMDDSQASARITSGSNVQFYVLCSLLIGYYLLIVTRHLPAHYALPVRFHMTDFADMWWQWLKLSAAVFVVLLAKVFIIFTLTRLFDMRGMARFHFFNWIRLLLVVTGAATIALFMYFVARGNDPSLYVVFLSIVIVTLAIWIAMAFFKLSGRTGHSMFHLFSYLCATEIIPLLITVKVLFQ